jgi:hypothetical protein
MQVEEVNEKGHKFFAGVLSAMPCGDKVQIQTPCLLLKIEGSLPPYSMLNHTMEPDQLTTTNRLISSTQCHLR